MQETSTPIEYDHKLSSTAAVDQILRLPIGTFQEVLCHVQGLIDSSTMASFCTDLSTNFNRMGIQTVYHHDRTATRARHMFRNATVNLSSGSVVSVVVMFDTGALHSSYVSNTFIEKHMTDLGNNFVPAPSEVILGDGQNTVKSAGILRTSLDFLDDKGKHHTANNMSCRAMPLTDMDFIIGLPHIVGCCSNFFMQILMSAIEEEITTFTTPAAMLSHVTGPE